MHISLIRNMKLAAFKNKYLYYLIGVILAGLIAIQVYWISSSIRLQKKAVDRILKEDFNNIVHEVEEDAYCFSFYSKAYLKRGEGVYIVRQKFRDGKFLGPHEGGYLDTLDMYNLFYMGKDGKDTVFDKERSITFSNMPATVDVSLKFSFVGDNNPRIRRTDSNSFDISGLTKSNFKQVLSNKFKIDEAIDVELLDELIVKALKKNKLDTVYEAGIKKEGERNYEYLKPGSNVRNLSKSAIKVSFLNNRFNKPYVLMVHVPDAFHSAIRSMAVMMVSSFIIMLILIWSYAYFIRTIMKQRRLSEMKNTFINNITHEFRTPITNINLAVENWRNMPEKGKGYLNIIEEENKHMERNVEQILQLATLEHTNGHSRYAFSNVNMHGLIMETAETFRIQLERAGGNMLYNFNASRAWVRGDAMQLKYLMHNLIDNAIKYRGKNLEITISTYNTGQQFSFEVADNGIGMSAETQKYIFTKFYRGNTGDRHDVKGFGLGLSYVKHIVDMHKGEIYVRSKLGKGTKFIICLPENI